LTLGSISAKVLFKGNGNRMGSAMVALLSLSVYSRPNHHRFDGNRV